MRRVMTFALTLLVSLATASSVRGEHQSVAALRNQIETWTAVLDSQTRRLYYEIREGAEGTDEQDQLLADARELWRTSRRINDRAMDGASASKLEREVRRLEDAFHAVEQQAEELRRQSVLITPLHKRLRRIDDLVHAAHDGIHDLSDLESANQQARGAAQPQIASPRNDGTLRTPQPRIHVEDFERRAGQYVEPPSVRLGPDGFYFDGRRFTIPLGR